MFRGGSGLTRGYVEVDGMERHAFDSNKIEQKLTESQIFHILRNLIGLLFSGVTDSHGSLSRFSGQ